MLVGVDLVCQVRDCLDSNYVGVIDMTYLTLGNYLKNDVDISELFLDI